MKKRVLSGFLALVMLFSLIFSVGGTVFGADTPDYTLRLKIEEGVGKTYSVKGSKSNPIDMPAGLSYDTDSGRWIMENFSFHTTAATAMRISSECTVELKGTNTVSNANQTAGPVYGIELSEHVTVVGSGSLTVQAGNVSCAGDAFSYGMNVANRSLTVKSGVVTIHAGSATSTGGTAQSVAIYGNAMKVDGGALHLTADAAVGSTAAYSTASMKSGGKNASVKVLTGLLTAVCGTASGASTNVAKAMYADVITMMGTAQSSENADRSSLQALTPSKEEGLLTLTGSEKYLLIHNHSWSYTASGASVSMSCGAVGHIGTESGTLTLSEPADLVYSAAAKNVRVDNEVYGYSAPDVTYYQSGTKLKGAPVNVGTYVAKMEPYDQASTVSNTPYIEFTITQKELSIQSATVAEKIYDGTDTAEITEVQFGGLAGSETLTLGTDYTATGVFDHADATGTNAASKVTVTVTLLDTDKANNYKLASAAKDVDASITKAASSCETKPVGLSVSHTGEAVELVTAGTASGGTVVYRVGESGEYSAQLPTAVKPGEYTVYYYVKGDVNHTDTEPDTVSASIVPSIKGVDDNPIIDEEVKLIAEETVNEVQELLKSNVYNGDGEGTAASETIQEVLGDTGYVAVKLTGIEFEKKADDVSTSTEITTYSFDVTPYDSNGEEQHELEDEITFRLPVVETDYPYADVYHEGSFIGQKEIHEDGYIEISSSTFSLYSYTLTDVKYIPSHSVTVADTVKNGTIRLFTDDFREGSTVILSVEPDDGCALKQVRALLENGWEVKLAYYGGTTYSFQMPEGDVVLEADFAVGTFRDVSPEDYAFQAVCWAKEKGITEGVNAETFAPQSVTTRAQMVTFLWRAAGCPEPTQKECSFRDVIRGSFYEKAVLWAAEKGITNGTSETAFSPNRTMTRAEAITFLFRYQGSKSAPDYCCFDDVSRDAYYYQAILWALDRRIVEGTGECTFSPDAPCTREQVVTLLYRQFGK